jgi:hypothetical protein
MADKVRIHIGVRVGVGNLKADPRVCLLIQGPIDGHIVQRYYRPALAVLDAFETAAREGLNDFLDCPLNLRCHCCHTSRIVVIRNGVEAAFVRNRHLLVVGYGLVGLMMAQQIKEKIQLDLHVLRYGGLFDLKTGVMMSLQLDRTFVNVNLDRLEMRFRMMVLMLGDVLRGLYIGFH